MKGEHAPPIPHTEPARLARGCYSVLKPACEVCGRTFARLSGSATGTMQVGSMATVLFAIVAWFVVAGMGLVSILLARTLPDSALGLAGWAYSSLAILTPLISIRLARSARRQLPDSARPDDEA